MAEYCCDALRQAFENYDLPFERPVCFDRETMSLHADLLAIRLCHTTSAGKVSRKNQLLVRLSYCPFCGKRILEEGNDERDQSSGT